MVGKTAEKHQIGTQLRKLCIGQIVKKAGCKLQKQTTTTKRNKPTPVSNYTKVLSSDMEETIINQMEMQTTS